MWLRDSSTSFVQADRKGDTRSRKDFLPALAMAGVGLIALGAAWMTPQERGDQYLLIASPAATRGETLDIIMKAGGRMVSPGRFGNIAVAFSADSNFPERLRKAGAWIAVEMPQNAGCLGKFAGVDTQS